MHWERTSRFLPNSSVTWQLSDTQIRGKLEMKSQRKNWREDPSVFTVEMTFIPVLSTWCAPRKESTLGCTPTTRRMKDQCLLHATSKGPLRSEIYKWNTAYSHPILFLIWEKGDIGHETNDGCSSDWWTVMTMIIRRRDDAWAGQPWCIMWCKGISEKSNK